MLWRSARRTAVAVIIAAVLTLGGSPDRHAYAQNPVSPPQMDWQWAGDPALRYLPEPYGIDRKTWIDNSTNPVTVWYVDHEGYLVRIQPLD